MIKRFSSRFLGMNSIVVEKQDIAIIIDPGVFPDEIQKIRSYLHENFCTPVAVLITHTHGDHISGWSDFSSVPTYTSNAFLKKSESERENDLKFLQGLYRKFQFSPDELQFPHFAGLLADQEIKYFHDFRVITIHIPGHAPDLTAYIFPEQQLLITGDMLVAIPVPYILYSIPDYWNSLEKLENAVTEYEPAILAPGHANFAHTRQEILARIAQEKNYLEELLNYALPLLRDQIPDHILEERLLECKEEWESDQAHRLNIKTLLRQKQEILKCWQ